MRYFIFRVFASITLIGFLMVPGYFLLHHFGWRVAAVSVLTAVCLAGLSATKRAWLGDENLCDLLFEEVHTGWQVHPLLTALIGLAFAVAGLWIAIKARAVGAPAPSTTEMSGIEQCWFGTVFVLVGIGIAGLGLSGGRGSPT